MPDVLERNEILLPAAALFAIEFVADKIPYVDNVWDAVHTAIRPTLAAVLGASSPARPTTSARLSPLCSAGRPRLPAMPPRRASAPGSQRLARAGLQHRPQPGRGLRRRRRPASRGRPPVVGAGRRCCAAGGRRLTRRVPDSEDPAVCSPFFGGRRLPSHLPDGSAAAEAVRRGGARGLRAPTGRGRSRAPRLRLPPAGAGRGPRCASVGARRRRSSGGQEGEHEPGQDSSEQEQEGIGIPRSSGVRSTSSMCR